MEFRIITRPELDHRAWDKLTQGASFYQTRYWADVCTQGIAGEAQALFLSGFRKSRLVAGMAAIVTARLGKGSFYSMPYGTYGGFVFDNDATDDEKREYSKGLGSWLQSGNFSLLEIVNFEGCWNPSIIPDVEKQETFAHIMKLEGANNDFFSGPNVRAEIKAGQRRGTQVVEVQHKDQVKRSYDIYLETEKRHGRIRPVYSQRFFNAIFDFLKSTGKLRWTVAVVKSRIIGSQINFVHGDTLYYWQGVMEYASRQYKPTYLLINDAIEYARNRELAKINMGASPANAPGLIEFKKKWGGVRYDYTIYRRRSRLRKLLGR